MRFKFIGRAAAAAFVLAVGIGLQAEPVVQCEFQPGKWPADDFLNVKSWRWPNIGKFIQDKDHLVNACPADASPEEMLSKRGPETYAALLYKKALTGNHTVSATMSFDHRMAPAIVIAEKPVLCDGRLHPEFRTHYEIVLYDRGLNIWRHWFFDGKQIWRKAGFLNVPFQPNTRYTLSVNIRPTNRGTLLTVRVGEYAFGIIDPEMPQNYYVGIIASEGVNRFYDFKIE